MNTYAISITELKEIYPTLQQSHGFDYYEIGDELTKVFNDDFDADICDEELLKQCRFEDGMLDTISYALNTNKQITIPVTADFKKQKEAIALLCPDNQKATTILIFMAAIFNRNMNDLSLEDNDYIKRLTNSSVVKARPEMLKLFIAINKPKKKETVYVGYKACIPETISNIDGWFSDMVNEYLHTRLGDISINEAEQELKTLHGAVKGKKPQRPLRNYIIHATYNLINELVIPGNGKVTVEQCSLLQKYIQIIGAIKDGNSAYNRNTLQSTVREYLHAKVNPVEKHKLDNQRKCIEQIIRG